MTALERDATTAAVVEVRLTDGERMDLQSATCGCLSDDDLFGVVEEIIEARLKQARAADFTPDQLTMLHRAVRQKLSRVRNDMARDRRRAAMHHAHAKARSRYDYASLLLVLDTMVPEERR